MISVWFCWAWSRPAVYLPRQRTRAVLVRVTAAYCGGAMSWRGRLRGYQLFCPEDGSCRLVQSSSDLLSPHITTVWNLEISCMQILGGPSTLQSCRCSHISFALYYLTKTGVLNLYYAMGPFESDETSGPLLREVYVNLSFL